MPGRPEEALLHEPLPIFLTIMAVILIAPLLSERVRLPGIIGLIVGGILIGPYGFRLLPNAGIILLFATVGLIYLMFNAGLEIDLGQFNRVRNRSIVFGLLTFFIPLVAGTIFGRVLGFSWLGAILLGSALSSHTLLAFPILTRSGVVLNETVAVTVGATVFTDVSAFLVLAIVTGISGEGGGSVGQVATLVALVIGFAALVLLGLPRLGRFFFRRFHGHSIEFQFVLVALFVTALVAEAIGMHAVVGAFLAGLAVNSTLPRHSQVTYRVLFLGEALFIPAFLIYSGMITDPAAFIGEGDALTIGIGLTVIAYVAKFLAAYITARIFHYSRDEMMTMFGLSQCQAAVTLPTVLVGVEMALFPASVFSGTMLMILATSVTSPLIVQRFARRLTPPAPTLRHDHLFERVLVPVSNPGTQEGLIRLAGILTREKGGTLMPLHIALDTQGQIVGFADQQRLMDAEVFKDADTRIQPLRRVDTSVARGILHSAIEQNASLIVLGWRGKAMFRGSVFGTVLDEVLWNARLPAMVARIGTSLIGLAEVIMVVTADSTAFDFLDEMAEAAMTIADALNAPLVVLVDAAYYERICDELKSLKIEHPYEVHKLDANPTAEIMARVDTQDLVLLSTTGTRQRFQSSLGTLPEQLAAQTTASLLVIHYPATYGEPSP